MWNLLKKNDARCSKLLDLLEESAAVRTAAASVEELSEDLSAAERTHLASCPRCRETAQDILAMSEQPNSTATKQRKTFRVRILELILSGDGFTLGAL